MNPNRQPSAIRRRNRGLTLIELLTVIAIVGVLASILFLSVGRVRQSAERVTSLSALRSSALSVLAMAGDEDGTLKTWKGGTGGTGGVWSVKLFNNGYLADHNAFYGIPSKEGIQFPTSNWYLYTWGMNFFDQRRSQSLNNLEDGYQIQLSAIDNPGDTILLADSILISSAQKKDTVPLQTFRLLAGTGVDNGTASGLRTRDGEAVLLSFFDGHVEQADFERLYKIGVRRVIDESGTIITLPAP